MNMRYEVAEWDEVNTAIDQPVVLLMPGAGTCSRLCPRVNER
jgi:hypothetical protein